MTSVAPTQISLDNALATVAAIREKQLAGKEITADERKVVGAVMAMAVDALEIDSNESLRRVLRLMSKDGQLGPKEQAALRDSLLQIDDLAKNPKLSVYLKELRAKGSATDEEVKYIQTLTKKLSIDEENAVYATLMSLSLAQGVSEQALTEWGTFVNDQTIQRLALQNKADAWAGAKRIGLMAALVTTFVVVTAFAPWATVAAAIGAGGAQALQIGAAVGATFALRPAFSAVERKKLQTIASYGVDD
jgi:hypothetical protein